MQNQKQIKPKKSYYWIFRLGVRWDGPHSTLAKAEEACIRARRAGHAGVYVEV